MDNLPLKTPKKNHQVGHQSNPKNGASNRDLSVELRNQCFVWLCSSEWHRAVSLAFSKARQLAAGMELFVGGTYGNQILDKVLY